MVDVNGQAPEFKAKAYHNEQFKDISLKDYKGKWVILFFYPKDFTFVCPTELGELADHYEQIRKLGAEVLSVSTDTEVVHKAWHDHSETIKMIQYPMLSDPTGAISKAYGVYIPDEGIALRGTFLIDPDGVLQAMEVHNDGIGRSADELIRKLQAAQFVREHGEVCPAGWHPGGKTLKPGIDLVGKI
jgi:peroxiredoxin